MGNNTCSCISNSVKVSNGFLKKSEKSNDKIALVLDTSGNIREMKLPMKSGELMIEEIGHVITEVDKLRRTRRVTPLPADEELVAGKVYLVVPVSRTHSKVSEFEMTILENWRCENESGQRKKLRESMVKVSPSPVPTFPCHRSRNIRDGENEEPWLGPNQARWNPVLDPIFE